MTYPRTQRGKLLFRAMNGRNPPEPMATPSAPHILRARQVQRRREHNGYTREELWAERAAFWGGVVLGLVLLAWVCLVVVVPE